MKKSFLKLFIIFFLFFPIFLLALELKYPSFRIFGQELTFGPEAKPWDLIFFIYYLFVILAGIFAFLVILYSGFIYLISAGNLRQKLKAKKQIKMAFYGLFILLASFLILNTINPQFLILKPIELERPGKIITKEGLEVKYPVFRIFGQEYTLTRESDPAKIFTFFYLTFLSVGGLIALLVLVLAGFRYLSISGWKGLRSLLFLEKIEKEPKEILKLKTQFLAALLGLALLLAAYLIAKTTNPQLVTFKAIELEKTREITPGPLQVFREKEIPPAIKYIFNIAILTAGFLALATLIYAGWLYLISLGHPEKKKKAKALILGGIFGLALLFSAYLILAALNPQLLILKIKIPGAAKLKMAELPVEKILPISCQEIETRRTLEIYLEPEKGLLDENIFLAKNVTEFSKKAAAKAQEAVNSAYGCRCSYTKVVCGAPSYPRCAEAPPLCRGNPCPGTSKIVEALRDEIDKGRRYIWNLGNLLFKPYETSLVDIDMLRKRNIPPEEKEIEKEIRDRINSKPPLKEINLEKLRKAKKNPLDWLLEDIRTCRANEKKLLLTCGQIKDLFGEEVLEVLIGRKDCDYLNLYCCGK